MVETAQTIVARVRILLRRVDDLKLPDETILMVMNQCLRGYLQKRALRIGSRDTERQAVTLTPTENTYDYVINLADTEFEVEGLSYCGRINENVTGSGEVTIVPLSAWQAHVMDNAIIGSVFGVDRIRLNIAACDIDRLTWTLAYRSSLLRSVQIGQKPPLPADHLPMLEYETAILAGALVEDDSEEWIAFTARTFRLWGEKLKDLTHDWLNYIETNVEPQIQPAIRSDRHRFRMRRQRAYVPPQ